MATTATCSTEVRQLIDQLVSSEATSRRELHLAEEMQLSSLQFKEQKDMRQTQRKMVEQQQREDNALIQGLRTLQRRLDSLAHEETKQRVEMEEQHELLLQAILRVLERDIQVDVDSVQYTDYLRVKYFNKTLAVIVKSEGGGRREIVNNERYGWLLMIQKHDSQATQLAIEMRLRDFRELQKSKLAALGMTGNSADLRRHRRKDPKAGASASARGPENVKPRTQGHLEPAFYDRVRANLEDRELAARAEIEADDEAERNAMRRLMGHVVDNVLSTIQRDALFALDDATRTFLRKSREIDRAEIAARAKYSTEEKGAWSAIERRVKRTLIKEARKWMVDATRISTHHRKLQDREQRMALARLHFAEKQARLANMTVVKVEGDPSSSAGEASPSFTPHPPLPQSLAGSRNRRMEAMNGTQRGSIESGANTVFQLAQLSASTRALQAVQMAGRLALEKEERLDRHALLISSMPPAAVDDKQARAIRRRAAQEQQFEGTVTRRIADEDSRSKRRLQAVAKEAELHRVCTKLGKAEINARGKIKAQEDSWWDGFLRHVDVVTGKLVGAMTQLAATEMDVRDKIVALEARNRSSIVASSVAHKPQSRVSKVPPLPPPRSMVDFCWKPLTGRSTKAAGASTAKGSAANTTRAS